MALHHCVEVSIPRFRDLQSEEDSTRYTVYDINVVFVPPAGAPPPPPASSSSSSAAASPQPSEAGAGAQRKRMSWRLQKRYSEFYDLHQALLAARPALRSDVREFRFPGKSVFNASADQKNKRREGFDRYLSMVASHSPLPVEFAEFLEIEQHLGSGRAARTAVANTGQWVGRSAPSSSVVSDAVAAVAAGASATGAGDSTDGAGEGAGAGAGSSASDGVAGGSKAGGADGAAGTVLVDGQLKPTQELTVANIVFTSSVTAILLFSALAALRIVDARHTSPSAFVFMIFCASSVLIFFRVALVRKEKEATKKAE